MSLLKKGLPSVKLWIISLCVLQVSGCAGTLTDDPAKEPNRLFAHSIVGAGLPVVVYLSGLGDDRQPWHDVINRVTKNVTQIAYDRPGYGATPASESNRDPCTIAREQRAFLRSVGLAPPYVLVGHSLGGLYQYAYAKLFPDDVAAIVFLDPTHPEHWKRLQNEAPVVAGLTHVLRASVFSEVMRREFDKQSECLNELDRTSHLAKPSRLLVRDRFAPPERGNFENTVGVLAQDWQKLIGAPRIERIPGSGHYLQRDRPDAVARIINEMVQRLFR
jgi:pimeloyl-ACP methyl ester carboxylesterase